MDRSYDKNYKNDDFISTENGNSIFTVNISVTEPKNLVKNTQDADASIVKNNNNDDPYADDCDIISDFMGHYGLWQFLWTFFLSIFQLPSTFHIFTFVFQSMEKKFWCGRPDNMTKYDPETWMNITQPEGSCTILDFRFLSDHNNNLDKYLARPDGMLLNKCNFFEYETRDGFGETLVSEWNLVCDRKNLLSVVEMCFLAGAACGSICCGWISDRFGRKHTLFLSAFLQAVLGTIIAFSNSLVMFMILRLLMGFVSMSVTVVSFVLVVELVSGKWRTIIGILNLLPVAITYILATGIAYLTKDWRLMQLVITLPWFTLLLMWYCVPESPRWLLEHGKIDELKKIIERGCKMNGRELPSNYAKRLEAHRNPQEEPLGLFVIFNKEFRRTTFLTLIIWFTLIIMYFGITLHLTDLGGDIYVNNVIAGTVESVSILFSVFVVLKLGIKINLVVYMLVCAIACLSVNLVPEGNLWAVIMLAMIGKCAIGANNAIIPTFTARQYPTVMRNLGVGVGNFAAGIAMIIVPYMWLLEHIQVYLPMTVMGICGIIGAIALWMTKSKTNDEETNVTIDT